MKIALTLPALSLGGVSMSVGILRDGLSRAGHDVDVIVTGTIRGDDFARARAENWSIHAINEGVRFLRERLQNLIGVLSQYDVVINNTSIETQLVLPCLPAETLRVSVMRGQNEAALKNTLINSNGLDATVGVSQEVVQTLRKALDLRSPVFLIPNCTPVRGDELTPCSEPLRVVYVGRVANQDKNVLILPDVAAAMVRLGLQFTLTVAGDGPDLQALRRRCEMTGVANRVECVGRVSREAAVGLLKTSHFVLLPSVYEGLSNVMLEGMAVGCVPITSDIENFSWVLGDVTSSLRAGLHQPEEYAAQLAALARAPDRYREIQAYLCRRQRECFAPEVTIRLYLELIEEVARIRDKAQFAPTPFCDLRIQGR